MRKIIDKLILIKIQWIKLLVSKDQVLIKPIDKGRVIARIVDRSVRDNRQRCTV